MTTTAGHDRSRPEQDFTRPARTEIAAQAALLVAAGTSQTEISRRLAVSDRILRRWAKAPWFVARVAELRRQVVDQTVGRLVSASTSAIETLKDLLLSDDERVKLGAAKAILDTLAKSRDGDEFEAEPDRGPVHVREIIIATREEYRDYLARRAGDRPAISNGNGHGTSTDDADGGPAAEPR